jgi:hypothetical protein
MRVTLPTRYGNFYSPLCLEPSPLDSYVSPLFQSKLGETSHAFTHGLPDSPSQQAQVLSPKARSPNWHLTQSAQLTSSAHGAGLTKKKKKPFKSHLPCMDSYANVSPTIQHQ